MCFFYLLKSNKFCDVERHIQRVIKYRFFCNWLIFDLKHSFFEWKKSDVKSWLLWWYHKQHAYINTPRIKLTVDWSRPYQLFVYLRRDYLLAIRHIIRNRSFFFAHLLCFAWSPNPYSFSYASKWNRNIQIWCEQHDMIRFSHHYHHHRSHQKHYTRIGVIITHNFACAIAQTNTHISIDDWSFLICNVNVRESFAW